MFLHIYTITHVAISLIAILAGFVVLFGLLTANRLDGWTKWFLIMTAATLLTGFLFPFHGFTPAFQLGIIATIVLALTLFARYPKGLAGPWRWVYVIGAVVSLYLNVFVGIVQSFQKFPALHALAPNQTEPPFVITQLVALILFLLLIVAGIIRFRIAPPPRAAIGG